MDASDIAAQVQPSCCMPLCSHCIIKQLDGGTITTLSATPDVDFISVFISRRSLQAREVVKANGLAHIITVIYGRVEVRRCSAKLPTVLSNILCTVL